MVIRGRVGWTAQLPSLSRIATPFEPAFAAAASGRPSPLKSAITRELGEPPVAVVIGAARPPRPSPKRTVRAPGADWLVTMTSSLPSPLTSLAVADAGALPAVKDRDGAKLPAPSPRNTLALLEK